MAEEITDRLQREMVNDESVHPLVRMVNRIHVVEEARHVRFARDELARQVASLSFARRSHAQLVIGRSALLIANRLTHPGVYAAVGLDPKPARAAARHNPMFRATLKWAGAKVATFLTEQGLLAGPGKPLWSRSGLI